MLDPKASVSSTIRGDHRRRSRLLPRRPRSAGRLLATPPGEYRDSHFHRILGADTANSVRCSIAEPRNRRISFSRSRNRTLDSRIVNDTLIPVLCAKAGVSIEDSRVGLPVVEAGRQRSLHWQASRKACTLIELSGVVQFAAAAVRQYTIFASSQQLAVLSRRLDQLAHMIEVFIDHDA